MHNNNPGNLRRWGSYHAVHGFVVFPSLMVGTTAMRDQLRLYGERGINTIQLIVNRWAPSSDNNNVAQYIATVTTVSGFTEHTKLDLGQPWQIGRLMYGMIRQEQGEWMDNTLLRHVVGMKDNEPLTGPIGGEDSPAQPGANVVATVAPATSAAPPHAQENQPDSADQLNLDVLNHEPIPGTNEV